MAAQQIGTVSETRGEVFARNADGQMRRLSKGDPVFERDVIITAAGSAAQITPTNGPVLNVAEQQTVSVDGTVVSGAPIDPSSGGVSPLAAAEAARVIQDPNALLEEEAAAAGLTGGDGNAGHGFVDLVRIAEGVGGANYGFPVYDRGGPELPGVGGDIENGLPTAGNLDISLDEDDIRSWNLDDRPNIGAWIGEFQTAVGNPWSAYYDFGNNDVVDSSDEIPVDSPTTMVGNLNFSYGPDGGGNIVFNTPTEALTSSGEEIHYWVSADGHSLVGYIYEGYDGQQPARVSYDGGGEDNYEEMSDVKVIFSAEITNVATGEFSFTIFGPLDHPIGGTEDNLVIPLKFTVSDATGDAAIGTLTVNIDDDSPVLAGYGEDSKTESLTDSVDEANIGTAWSTGTDANDGPVVTSGDLSGLVDFGADGEGSFGFSSNFLQTLYSTDFWWGIPVPVQLKYSIVNDGDTTTLVATEPDMPLDLRNSTNKVFELELNTTNGEYEFRLYDELRHTGDSDESLTLNFGAIIEAKDYDGDPVSLDGAFQINVVDDVPNAQISLRGEDFVQHDETPGVQNAYPDKDVSSVGLKFLGISNTGDDANVPGSGAIGYARSGNPVVTTAGSEAGADHLASDSLSLVVLNTASGLQTTEGYDITLSMDNAGRIIGRVNDTDAGAMNGKAAFAIALDQNGEVFVAQYLSLNHPNAASADEVINLSGKVAVRYTMTDTDGDTRSADVDVGTSVRFADDGPTLTQQTISQNILEANIDTAWSTGSNMSSASPNNVPTVVTGSLAGLVNFGADGANGQGSFSFTADATSQLNSLHLASYDGGARPLSYAITYDGNVAVLTATETDGPGYGNSSNPVFVLRLDQATGQYTFTLSDELMHTGQGQGDVIGLNFGSMIQAKDGDNDPVLLGRSFTINVQDDVPAPENDFRTINEDTYGWISGNVLDNDESGADHQTSFNWLNTKGKYGDFDGFSNGGYTYNLDNDNAQQLDDGEKWVEQFKYTIKDSDGDERPAVLTITIEGRNDQPTIKVDTGNWFNWNDEVEESDMATGLTPSGSGEFAYGTFKVADPDGLDDIKTVNINGTDLNIGGMVGKHIDGAAGTLTITGYNDKTGEATYKYELTEATIDGKGTETDVFKLTVSDGDLTDTATITIDIIDDRPTARSDVGNVTEGGTLTKTSLDGVLFNDTVGADVPGVVIGVRSGSNTSTEASGNLDTAIAGKYGTLNLHADGSYTYQANANFIGEDKTDTFVYTMRDNDGDKSTTTLKINVDNVCLDVDAWNDSLNNGKYDGKSVDNQPETFTVTSTPVLNDANAFTWIGSALKESIALTPTQIANSAPRDITLKTTSDITFTFLSEGAGYQNTVGWYDVKDPSVGHIVWNNSSAQGSDGSLVGGVSSFTVPDVPAGTQLGFFLIPDATSPDPAANNLPTGSTVYFANGHAYADAAHTTPINSTDNGMPNDADPVWFSNNPNPDGLQHAITGLSPSSPANLLYVGFEDLGNGGDKDYNDVVFTVDLGEGNDIQFDPVVFDLGVNINGNTALKMATIDFTLGDGDTISFDTTLATKLGLEVSVDKGDVYTIKATDGSEPALSFDGLLDTFQINVGFTGTGQDYKQVDADDRTAEVKVYDSYGNFDVATATFDLNVVLPPTKVDPT